MKALLAYRLARLYMRAGFRVVDAIRIGWKNAR
jgi:hypothetical protein